MGRKGPFLFSFLESKHNKWKQHATTVAGGNGRGKQLNQLSCPRGISIDHKRGILIADFANHRVVRWEWQAKEGTVVAGGNGKGNRRDQLNWPTDVIVDKENHSIIIADVGNRRVIRWFEQSQTNPKILIDDIACWGLTMGNDGFLYVSDREKNEVRRWKEGESRGTLVAGGNGEGDQLNQLNWPTFLFVDDQQSIYVTDRENDRVMKWRKGAKEGLIVAGGNGGGSCLNRLSNPHALFVDRWGQIYVGDSGNQRVMRWREGESEGEIVVGGNGEGEGSNQLSSPTGISMDDEGNLYVADYGNHRIQKFDLIVE